MEDEIPQQLLSAGIGYPCLLYTCQAALLRMLPVAAPTSSYKKGLLSGRRSGFHTSITNFLSRLFIDVEPLAIHTQDAVVTCPD